MLSCHENALDRLHHFPFTKTMRKSKTIQAYRVYHLSIKF